MHTRGFLHHDIKRDNLWVGHKTSQVGAIQELLRLLGGKISNALMF
jgi:hypothetical protein